MAEKCKYEEVAATIPIHIKTIKEDIGSIKSSIEHLTSIISGNGGVGLVTQTALNKASIKRLWVTLPCLITIFIVIVGIVRYWK